MGLFGDAGKFITQTSGGINPLGNPEIASVIPGVGDAQAAAKQNAAAKQSAQDQMNFQERMSSTAYQRGMDDMKKAGLNPMLAFSQGGASAPSGASYSPVSETKTKLGEMGISSALGVKGLQQQQQSINNQQAQTESSINLNKSTAAKQLAETQKTQAETIDIRRNLPASQLQHDLSQKASGVIRQVINSMSTSAKDVKKLFDPKIKLIPAHGSAPAFPKQQPLN